MDGEKSIQRHWEDRARRYGNSLRSVLFQGLPDRLNELIHRWHSAVLTDTFAPLLAADARVLDIGGGYGRLGHVLRRKMPRVHMIGLELNPVYCRHYAAAIGPAVCGSVTRLPWQPGCCDGALLVTMLMYVDRTRCRDAVKSVLSCLRVGGVALFVDPGFEFMQLHRRVCAKSGRPQSVGSGFKREEYRTLFENAPVSVVAAGGNSIFTAALPFLLLSARCPSLTRQVGRLAVFLDTQIPWFSTFALHRWVVVRRNA